jgi:hypothetical protein
VDVSYGVLTYWVAPLWCRVSRDFQRPLFAVIDALASGQRDDFACRARYGPQQEAVSGVKPRLQAAGARD